MNIFVLDTNPEKAARFHNDRHVIKMILETCQLLATAHHVLDGALVIGAPLRPTHVDHPCALWARATLANYQWLHTLGGALLAEFAARYGHAHSYAATMHPALATPPLALPAGALGPWPLCMPTLYRGAASHGSGAQAVCAYRAYYRGAKQHLASWRAPATEPEWWAKPPCVLCGRASDNGHATCDECVAQGKLQ